MRQAMSVLDARLKRLEYLARLAEGGGGEGGSLPLSRYKIIDGGATETTRNGSWGPAAFKSVTEWIASLGTSTTAADSQQQQAAKLTPCLAGYTENVAFPAYRSVSITADTLGLGVPGAIAVTGNATFNNLAGTNHAPTSDVILEIDVNFTGSFTGTDDAVGSAIVIGGTPALPVNFAFSSLDTHTMTHLLSLSLLGRAISGAANVGTNVPVVVNNGGVVGLLTCKNVVANIGNFGSITLSAGGSSAFAGCGFYASPVITGTQTSVVSWDSVSLRAFAAAGGVRSPAASDVGPVFLVAGGYNGGSVGGANLPTTAGPTAVSLNGTGAAVGYRGSNSGNHYTSTGLTQNSVVQALTGGGEQGGDTLLFTKTDLAASSLTIHNNAGATLGVIPASSRGFLLLRYSVTAADWVLAECGSLAA